MLSRLYKDVLGLQQPPHPVLRQHLVSAAMALPDSIFTAVFLYYVQHKSCAAIAAATGGTPQLAERRIRSAIGYLRARLDPPGQ